VEEHQAQSQKEQTARAQYDMKEIDRKMTWDQERLNLIDDIERKCEQAAQEKYSKMLQSIENHWKKVLHCKMFY
jgi:phage shock protein A